MGNKKETRRENASLALADMSSDKEKGLFFLWQARVAQAEGRRLMRELTEQERRDDGWYQSLDNAIELFRIAENDYRGAYAFLSHSDGEEETYRHLCKVVGKTQEILLYLDLVSALRLG